MKNTKYGVYTLYLYIGGIIMAAIIHECTVCGKKKICFYRNEEKNVYVCGDCIGTLYSGLKMKVKDSPEDEYARKLLEKYDNRIKKIEKDKELEKILNGNNSVNNIKPSEVKSFLDQYVIGQDVAKKALSVALYNHYKRISTIDSSIEKSNILMLGPTGCGKTLLAKTLAKKMNVPFTIVDATDYSETGYVGRDVESILTQLLAAANNDIARAEKGIIYIDEFDKIATKESNGTNAHDLKTGVQQALLKLIEGSVVELPLKIPGAQTTIRMNTKNILFICGGSFAEFDKKKSMKTVGFVKETIEEEFTPDMQLAGIIPELLGRLPVVVNLNPLTEDDLLKILTEPQNCIVNQYKELFAYDGIELEFTKEALDRVVKIAIEKKVGARGLRRVIENAMQDIMFDAPSMDNISKCIITEDTIFTGIPILEYKNAQNAMSHG